MEKQELTQNLIAFLTTETACHETLRCLSKKACLEIIIAEETHIEVRFDGEQVAAQENTPSSPDFIFNASPDAISVLISETGLSPAQLGIKFVKQILSRDIRVSMPNSLFHITRMGYLNIIKVGGMEFLSELKKHDLASLSKITGALSRLRK